MLPREESIVSESGAEETLRDSDRTVLALDVGTTTLALALVSLDEKRIIRVVTRANPQRTFGADVISRIAYCRTHGCDLLQSAVLDAVRAMLRELDAPGAQTLYAAGNTTMLHLLFGADPSPMGVYPYTPAFLDSRTVSGERLGLPGVQSVISLPCAAAFVGADVTAGLCFIGSPEQGKYRMLVDLGTNAEVVLFSAAAGLCTSASAGPCFEGADISCGMSASSGAIYAYTDEGYKTVDDAPAVGICGTGLVDVIACLLRNGTIDETGYMACETFEIAAGVTLTQRDVRQYQLAKAAVSAAVQTLMQKQCVCSDDIDALYISGGFSAKINIANAVRTGLLSAQLQTKSIALGNSSLLGTVRYACEQTDLAPPLARLQSVDLAADPLFSDLFMKNLSF